MIRLPPAPKGNSHHAAFLRQLLAYVKSITPRQTPTVSTDITPSGAFPKVKPGAGGTGSSSGGGARWA